MKGLLTLPVLVLLTSNVSFAASANCSNINNLSDKEVSACYSKSEKELNAVYKELTSRFKDMPHLLQPLKVAQRSWLKFRTEHCDFSYNLGSASSAKNRTSETCIAQVNLDRIKQLKEF